MVCHINFTVLFKLSNKYGIILQFNWLLGLYELNDVLTKILIYLIHFSGKAQHFGKQAYSLFCQE